MPSSLGLNAKTKREKYRFATLAEMERRLELIVWDDPEERKVAERLIQAHKDQTYHGVYCIREFKPYYHMSFLGDAFFFFQWARVHYNGGFRYSLSRWGDRGRCCAKTFYVLSCLACVEQLGYLFLFMLSFIMILSAAFMEPIIMLCGILCCCGIRRKKQGHTWDTVTTIRWTNLTDSDLRVYGKADPIKYTKANSRAECLSFNIPPMMQFLAGMKDERDYIYDIADDEEKQNL